MGRSREERICFDARRHGVVLVRPFVHSATLVALAGPTLAVGWPLTVLGAVLLAGAAAVMLLAVWRWDRTRLVVTHEELYVVHGTLRRRVTAIRLSRVGAVELEQTLVGRLLGYGTLVAGELEIEYVPEARRVYGLVGRLAA